MTSRTIVVGYDGSEPSRLSLTWAMRAAAERGASVLVVHVLEPPVASFVGLGSFVRPAHEAARAAAERMLLAAEHESRLEQPGVPVTSRVVEGPTVPVLLEQVADAEMAVVGSRGLGTFGELLIGSAAVQLATYAPCPVVVVRSLEYTPPGSQAGRVVVGVDGSPSSVEAVGFAFAEASMRGAGLTAVHAWAVPYLEHPVRGGPVPDEAFIAEVEEAEMCTLSEALAGWREKYPDVDVRQDLVHGDAAQALVASSAGAELVVVGSRGHGGFRTLLLGSVSHTVLSHSRTAVAVVRPHQAW